MKFPHINEALVKVDADTYIPELLTFATFLPEPYQDTVVSMLRVLHRECDNDPVRIFVVTSLNHLVDILNAIATKRT